MANLTRKLLTLALIKDGQRVLLGYKKRGFGEGKWNMFGGKVEKGETPEYAAIREVKEESGLEVIGGVEQIGDLEFTFDGEDFLMHVLVFQARGFSGTPAESEEMRPQWYQIEDIPYSKMWKDDEFWYPIALRGGKFKGKFHFQGHEVILNHTLEEVEHF
ncbi:unnamed protein product [Meganyctiphanes norvegica]|uniref:Oxidized purine nucleoside triphosphate hydrolase n=1 Tax=Meganyctiphanes norvegica TaxID=48144 RepID=A0AAV2S0N4_MEGNR